MTITRRSNGFWDAAILPRASEIVSSYSTRVTLRQLHYRLVSEESLGYRNTSADYKQLSKRTAELRRTGMFPALMDAGRCVEQVGSFESPEHAREWLRQVYRRDRTEGQAINVYIGVEKQGHVAQLKEWFGEPFGIPILPLGGYSSQTFDAEMVAHADADDRESVLLYAGDLDCSGEDIERNLRRHTDFDSFVRVALTIGQADEHGLARLPGKPKDPRARAFVAKYGSLFQIELDALDPDLLRDLFADTIARLWDVSNFDAVLEREAAERKTL